MRRRQLRRLSAVAWLRLLRLPAAAAVGIAAAGLVAAWSDGAAAWHVVLRYAAAAALLMSAAAAANDAADAERDGRSRLWRPIPAGQVAPRGALLAAAALAAAALALAASIGWLVLAVAAAMALAAAAYSAAMRGAVLGCLGFALIGMLLPIGAALAVDADAGRAALWWAAPVGGAAGLAFFAVYKLPDFERDDEDGARGVLHWVGIDAALPLGWGATALALALALASVNLAGSNALWIYGPLGYLLAVALAAGAWLALGVTERKLAWQRNLVAPGILALLVGWFGAIASG